MRRDPMAIVAAMLFTCTGCEGPGLVVRPIPLGPVDVFTAEVEPVLEARCAQGGCHGRPDRPFVLFAPGAHRLDATRLHLFEPLTPDEIGINARRLAALADAADPDGSFALRKPLAVSAGGLYHGGGDVFVDRSDRDYATLRRWLVACAPAPEGI